MSTPFPEPTTAVPSRAKVFLGYLDYFRSRLVSKLEGLPAGELRSSRDGRWHVAPEETLADLTAALHTQAARTRAAAGCHELVN